MSTKWRKAVPWVDEIPPLPGVYGIYINRKLLYIGRSTNLKFRILGHFSTCKPTQSEDRIGFGLQLLIRETDWFYNTLLDNPRAKIWSNLGFYNFVKFKVTDDYWNLEARLIQRLLPKYNVARPTPKYKQINHRKVRPVRPFAFGVV